ncbi:cytochrome c [Xanthobacter sp. DSM 24535]|uniref:c-type cytochrome n=1 Tax=Roseixanthobacter psychrophilus TaxID=3119917 RepID=UPI00372C3DCC
MHRSLLAVALLGTVVAPLTASAAPTALTSVSVDLPPGDRLFPDGAGAEAINNNCLACHSTGMVLNQPPLSAAVWGGVVTKMINVYKAPVDPADVDAIVGYLAKMKVSK